MGDWDINEDSFQVYYPSMIVNMQVRFEEGALPFPSGPPKSSRDLAAAPATSGTATEPAILKMAPGQFSVIRGIVPRSCSVELPAYRQAGTFNFTMEWRDFPIDPRMVRAVGVAIHLGCVRSKDWSRGITTNPEGGGRRGSILTDTPDNLLITGTADGVSTDFGSSMALLQIEGRDLRGIFLDATPDPGVLKNVDLTQPIDKVVKAMIQGHPQCDGIWQNVSVNPQEWPNSVVPSPGGVAGADVERINMDALGQNMQRNEQGDTNKKNFWDLITQYCFLVGAVPYFVGSKLWIRPARSLFDAKRQDKNFDPSGPATPFKDGLQRSIRPPLADTSEMWAHRRLIFGRDISTFKLDRKLGGIKSPIIRCVSTDTSLKGKQQLLEGEYPAIGDPARKTNVGPSGEAPMTEVRVVYVDGIKNKTRLEEIARDIYEETGRQEISGSVSTKNLASFGGSNQDTDLIRLRPGDPIEFLTESGGLGTWPPTIHELTGDAALSDAALIEKVGQRLGDKNLARILVSSSRGHNNTQLQSTFRTSTVKFDWSAESGIGISCDFQNYIESRSGALGNTGNEPAPNDAAGGGGTSDIPDLTGYDSGNPL